MGEGACNYATFSWVSQCLSSRLEPSLFPYRPQVCVKWNRVEVRAFTYAICDVRERGGAEGHISHCSFRINYTNSQRVKALMPVPAVNLHAAGLTIRTLPTLELQVSFLLQYFKRPHIIDRYVERLQAVANDVRMGAGGEGGGRVMEGGRQGPGDGRCRRGGWRGRGGGKGMMGSGDRGRRQWGR